MSSNITRVYKLNRTIAARIPHDVAEQLLWKPGDVLAYRVAGHKLILERVALENLARLKAPDEQGVKA